jgi:hypothetical protein
MSRQDEIVEWRRNEMTNMAIRWFFRTAVRRWYLSVPLVTLVTLGPVLGIVAGVVCGGVFYRLRQLKAEQLAALHELAGGEHVYRQLQHYAARWPDTARSVGLTLRASEGPLGVVAAADRHLSALQHKLAEDAYGKETDRVPELTDISRSPLGIRHEVKVLNGQTFEQYRKAAPALAELWQVETVRVQRARPGYVWITPVSTDPLAQTVEITPDSLHPATDLVSVPLGMTEDGTTWTVPLDETSSVFGGVPGAGKSVAINVLLANVSHRPDVQIIGMDMKGGLEMGDWEPRCAAVAFDQESAVEVLNKLFELHKSRMAMLKGNFASMARYGYSPEHPLYLVVIDEAAELFAPEGNSKEAKALANELLAMVSRIVRLCRATGIVILLATQKPTADSLPTIIRDNAQAKVGFRCTTAEQAVSILGDAVRHAEFIPTDIKIADKGVAVSMDADGVFRRVRAFFISETSRRAVVAATQHLARPLGTPPAVTEVYDEPDEDDEIALPVLPPRRTVHAGLPEGVVPCVRNGSDLVVTRDES